MVKVHREVGAFMGERQHSGALAEVRRLIDARAACDLSDEQLVEAFADRGDPVAFEVVLRRYGALVLSVCRRRLSGQEDVEDAFQATFLVLVRKAGSLTRRDRLSSWLFGVANRVATRAALRAARLSRCRRPLVDVPAASVADAPQRKELSLVLDEEVQRLPEKYRAPLLLCHFQSRTQEEAARLLGWSTGTVATRVRRARELLGHRLVRRGVALSVGAMATVPPALEAGTLRACLHGEGARATAATLAARAAQEMLLARWKLTGALVLALGALGAGAVAACVRLGDVPSDGPGAASPAQVQADWFALGSFRALSGAGYVNALAFAPDGKSLALATVAEGAEPLTQANGVYVWDVASGRQRVNLAAPEAHTLEIIHALAFSPDGKYLAAADTNLFIWATANGKLQAVPPLAQAPTFLRFAPDSKTLAVAASDGALRLYDTATGRGIVALPGHKPGALCLDFSPDGSALFSVGLDETVRTWGLSPARMISEHRLALGRSSRALLSRDGATMVTWSIDEASVRAWDVALAKERFLRPAEDSALPDAVALSPDGKLVAIASNLGRLTVWDAREGVRTATLPRHPAQITALAFGADGRSLASADLDGVVRLWKASPGNNSSASLKASQGE